MLALTLSALALFILTVGNVLLALRGDTTVGSTSFPPAPAVVQASTSKPTPSMPRLDTATTALAPTPSPSAEAKSTTTAPTPRRSSATSSPTGTQLPAPPKSSSTPSPTVRRTGPTVGSTLPRVQIPGRFEVEDYRAGGEGIGYHELSTGNLGRTYREDDVDIEQCIDGDGCYNVGYVQAGEWLAYDVKIAAPTHYRFLVRISAPSDGGRFHIELNGRDVSGSIAVPNTGSYEIWGNITVDVALPEGDHTLRLVADSGGFNWNYVLVRPRS